MSVEDARTFVRKLFEDAALRRAVDEKLDVDSGGSDATDSAEVRESLARVIPDFAAERGYEFTAEEGFEALRAMRESVENEELSDAELDKVAGGGKGGAAAASVTTLGIACAGVSIHEESESGHCDLSDNDWGSSSSSSMGPV